MIILTHHTGEPHAILGAQVAATFLQRRLSIPSIVVGIEREFSKEPLLRFIEQYYSGLEKKIAFSHLCGRKDILDLIRELKQADFVTILGGPQARQDYRGEPEADLHPHRFRGLKSIIDIAFHGPVDNLRADIPDEKGLLFEYPWTKSLFLEVDWENLYTFSDRIKKIDIRIGQVLGAVGCPYAGNARRVTLPPPTGLRERGVPDVEIRSEGCIFCDVSREKTYHGPLDQENIMAQISGLPDSDGKKIPFELINEYPLHSLGKILEEAGQRGLNLSQINLVCRVDDINAHASLLPEILSAARRRDIRIMFASIGFESFSDRLLRYFCKGITVEDSLRCVETLRRLKEAFPHHLFYRRDEGANHGFIRPTPWDDGETMRETDRNIFLHRLFEDVLPEHSTPLIIHHASYLGDWIREIESRSDILFGRDGTWIEWWNPSSRGPAQGGVPVF
jgi:hypothetical protein